MNLDEILNILMWIAIIAASWSLSFYLYVKYIDKS